MSSAKLWQPMTHSKFNFKSLQGKALQGFFCKNFQKSIDKRITKVYYLNSTVVQFKERKCANGMET